MERKTENRSLRQRICMYVREKNGKENHEIRNTLCMRGKDRYYIGKIKLYN